jgi:hypothetical protein
VTRNPFFWSAGLFSIAYGQLGYQSSCQGNPLRTVAGEAHAIVIAAWARGRMAAAVEKRHLQFRLRSTSRLILRFAAALNLRYRKEAACSVIVGISVAMSDIEPASRPPVRSTAFHVSVTVAAAMGYLILSFVAAQLYPDAIRFHFAAVIALPIAAAFSFLLVTLLPMTHGPFEFQALGVTLKGGAVPIVLWMICFAIVVAAIKLLW